MIEKSGRGEVKRAFSFFLGFVLVYSAVGIPAYIFYQRHRAEDTAAEREREAVEKRSQAERARQEEALEALERRPPPALGGIRGPNAGRNPLVPHDGRPHPASPYDYLPAEQRRMLRSGPAQGPDGTRSR